MAPIQHLLIDQGATFTKTITVMGAAGLPFDLTDFTQVIAQFRRSPHSLTAYSFTATIDDDPTTGRIVITLPAEVSATIPSGRYVYDVLIIDDVTPDRIRVLEGILTITPSVSRQDEEP